MNEWRPGDPVYPAEVKPHGSCGPCLVRWTAETDSCPECGELSTEAVRAALARVRALCAANLGANELLPSEPLTPRQVLCALDGTDYPYPN